MQVRSTEFRSNVFSKLARAKRQKTLLCHPDSIVHNDKALSAKMEAEWR